MKNVRKIPEILGKLSEIRDKNGVQRGENHMKTFFRRSSQTWSVWEEILKYSNKELLENFSGKFGEIRAKIFRTSKPFPAPTPMHKDIKTFYVSICKKMHMYPPQRRIKW